ncbi:MAG: cytochrome c oxidase subunit 3 [Candidatus Omnitrophica bacterium]|nr:cytochrome c oxidase subunit 3 [Candidatus Omnitrophota bacterium]MBI3010041.1 cytochrome c oxidase subunit 3 [Candidatus Omnitrophota bacterium]
MSSKSHALSVSPGIPVATATGIPNGKLGMWVFLASEVMFFTGLIGAYIVLRLSHPSWPGPEHHLSVGIGTFNTLVLICSSTTIVLALAAAEHRSMKGVRLWLIATILLGLLFLGIKGWEYSAKFSHHIFPSTNVFWSCYYALTAFHALHVLGGIGFNLWVLGQTTTPALWVRHGHRLELAGLYWHFVDIVWIFLFPLLYLFS